MKPTDIRNTNWHKLRSDLAGRIQEVYTAWVCHGPCTTRQLAQRSGIDILNVRPRTTDLVDCGLVELLTTEAGEGIYAVREQPAWEAWQASQIDTFSTGQIRLL